MMDTQNDENQSPRERADALLRKGRDHTNASEFPQAQNCLTQALALSREIGDSGLEADGLIRLGTLQYSLSDYTAALSHYQEAQNCLRDRDEPARAADAATGVGVVYFSLGDFARALTSYSEALALSRLLDMPDSLSRSLNNIGGVYAIMGDHVGALRYFREGLEISRTTGKAGVETICLGNIALSCSKAGQHVEALAAGRRAVEVARRAGSSYHECRMLLMWADASTRAGQAADALPLYTEALALARSLPDPTSECVARMMIGDEYLTSGRLHEAQAEFSGAMEIAGKLGLRQFESEAHQKLSEACKLQGDPTAALVHYQRFHEIEREVFSEDADRRAKGLMIQMEVERSQREAEIHRLRNVELMEANTALEEAGRRLQAQAELLEAQAEELRAQNEELQSQSEALERQAAEDGLTGLANRRHLEDWLSRQFCRSHQGGGPITVVMADVDHFKQVNDRFGHQIGDEVLMTIGRLFRLNCRATDLAARYGGEEFVLALPGTEAGQAFVLCERIRQAVETYPWTGIHPDLSLTLSLGLSDDPDAVSHERLLALADAQLYAAKRDGRNRTSPSVYAPSLA